MTTRAKYLIAGLVLIAVTNAVALGGAWYNRSGAPESVLTLSERELAPSWSWGVGENSGYALRIKVRAAHATSDDDYSPYDSRLYDLDWLTAEKLASLGFDTSLPPDAGRAMRHYGRQLPRYAYLVLELAGPAYEQALAAVRKKFAEAQRVAAAKPGDKEAQNALERHRNWLVREENDNTRLFVVDAGPDLATLRAKYPDRARYAIARGHVTVTVCAPQKKERLCGNVEGLEVDTLNVPLALHGALADAKAFYGKNERVLRYTARVAWGRRLEPWLQAVEPGEVRTRPAVESPNLAPR